jgi:porphobilinogen synthase
MPGVSRLSISQAVTEAGELAALGVPGVLLFGIPDDKDAEGSGAWDDEGVVQLAIRAIKEAHPDLLVMTDVCLCEYTSHGHCGSAHRRPRRQRRVARAARANCGEPRPRRRRRDRAQRHDGRARRRDPRRARRRGLQRVPISPTRRSSPPPSTARFARPPDSAPAFGDRRSYQMDPANGREALREVELDIAEGADIVMVKPALAYLDVIARFARGRCCRSRPTT